MARLRILVRIYDSRFDFSGWVLGVDVCVDKEIAMIHLRFWGANVQGSWIIMNAGPVQEKKVHCPAAQLMTQQTTCSIAQHVIEKPSLALRVLKELES